MTIGARSCSHCSSGGAGWVSTAALAITGPPPGGCHLAQIPASHSGCPSERCTKFGCLPLAPGLPLIPTVCWEHAACGPNGAAVGGFLGDRLDPGVDHPSRPFGSLRPGWDQPPQMPAQHQVAVHLQQDPRPICRCHVRRAHRVYGCIRRSVIARRLIRGSGEQDQVSSVTHRGVATTHTSIIDRWSAQCGPQTDQPCSATSRSRRWTSILRLIRCSALSTDFVRRRRISAIST